VKERGGEKTTETEWRGTKFEIEPSNHATVNSPLGLGMELGAQMNVIRA